jgi:putative CocE/NonD family hydrolase
MSARVSERVRARRADRLPRHVRMLLRMGRRQLPAPLCEVAVERGIEVPAGDGVPMVTDHYRPLLPGPRPTLLVRTSYGRGFPWDYVYGALFARQGFHVVIQSCRGTAGSGGELEPFLNEAADAHAAVAWLREQDWFNGALGTVGASYLGHTQWALATDPPPELLAMVIQVSSEDFYEVLYPGGAFALEATLTATTATLTMERGFGRFLLAAVRLLRHIRRVERTLPFIDAYPAAFGRRVSYFENWLTHPGRRDPYWAPRRTAVPAELTPPASLLTGWWDVCLDPTLASYRKLRAAGRDVRLVVGPWNHASGFNEDMPTLLAEALSWLRAHLDGDRSSLPRQPVRVHVGRIGGPGQWRDLADWPPPDARSEQWELNADGTLTPGALSAGPPETPGVSSFRYDPAHPTPTVGGPSLNSRAAGPKRNNAIEARDDVLVFTSEPLPAPLEVIGPVSVRLSGRGSGSHFDVFARLCDVDERGRSWNICDGLVRVAGGDRPWHDLTVPMSATAHRFNRGHRLRVQISGGAHPRYARNTGTGEPWATTARLVTADIEIGHGAGQPCVLSIPVVSTGR